MHGQSLTSGPGPIVPLPAVQTSATSCVSCHQPVRLPIHLLGPEQGMEQGSAPRCPLKAEGMGLRDNSSVHRAAVHTCLHGPHAFQGPSTERAPGSKSPEQREQRQKPRPGDRSPQTVTLQALGPAPPGKPGTDHTHTHTPQSIPFPQVGIFIQKPDYQSRDPCQQLTGHKFQVERRKRILRKPCFLQNSTLNLKSSSDRPGQNEGLVASCWSEHAPLDPPKPQAPA